MNKDVSCNNYISLKMIPNYEIEKCRSLSGKGFGFVQMAAVQCIAGTDRHEQVPAIFVLN